MGNALVTVQAYKRAPGNLMNEPKVSPVRSTVDIPAFVAAARVKKPATAYQRFTR